MVLLNAASSDHSGFGIESGISKLIKKSSPSPASSMVFWKPVGSLKSLSRRSDAVCQDISLSISVDDG